MFSVSLFASTDTDGKSKNGDETVATSESKDDPEKQSETEEQVSVEPIKDEFTEAMESSIPSDSSINSISRYNFIFYFIYKYKYENRTGVDEIKALSLD